MKSKKKVRKPKGFGYFRIATLMSGEKIIFMGQNICQLSEAKNLHKWLGKAIIYLEQKQKEK